MNNKGGALSIIIWMAGAFVIIFFLAGFVYFHNTFTNVMLSAGTNLNTNVVNLTQVTQQVIVPVNNAMTSLTWISFVMIVTLAFAILIENFYIREHPILFFVHVMVMILGVVGAIYVSNAYESLLNTGPLAGTLQTFTASSYIVLYLPVWVAVIGIFGIVLLLINANRDPEVKFRGGGI
jgi:hypothetical protein